MNRRVRLIAGVAKTGPHLPILKAAGFETHRVTFSEPGAADIDNLYARIGNAKPDRKSVV